MVYQLHMGETQRGESRVRKKRFRKNLQFPSCVTQKQALLSETLKDFPGVCGSKIENGPIAHLA